MRRFEEESFSKARAKESAVSCSAAVVVNDCPPISARPPSHELQPRAPFAPCTSIDDMETAIQRKTRGGGETVSSSYDDCCSIPAVAVVATPVDPTDISAMTLPVGKSEKDLDRKRSPFRSRKVLCCLCLAILVIVGLATILAYFIGQGTRNRDSQAFSADSGNTVAVDVGEASGNEQGQEETDGGNARPTRHPNTESTPSPTGSPVQENTLGNQEDEDIDPAGIVVTTSQPTFSPTAGPLDQGREAPTSSPTVKPTSNPTSRPTGSPTFGPTGTPTLGPTGTPTRNPTAAPTGKPTIATLSPTTPVVATNENLEPNSSAETSAGPWPSCLGMKMNSCRQHISSLAPGVTFEVIRFGNLVTLDFVYDRVRLVQKQGKIVEIPKRG